MAKAIVHKLQMIMPHCIDEAQSAFVPGRLITDNVIVAFELLHTFKRQVGARCSSFALKLNMSKAYDRVEWPLIATVMLKMGFKNGWVDLIMRYVQSVSYFIMLNGQTNGLISPT